MLSRSKGLVLVLALLLGGAIPCSGQDTLSTNWSRVDLSGQKQRPAESAVSLDSTEHSGSVHRPSFQITGLSTRTKVKTAIQLIQSDRVEEARSLLETAIAADSGLVVSENPAAAYWLAHIYEKQEQPRKAYEVLQTGMAAFDRNQDVDLRLADEFVRATMRFNVVSEYERATRTFLRMLPQFDDESIRSEERALVDRNLREMAVVLPEGMQERIGLYVDPIGFDIEMNLIPEAGEILAGWWRSQDPLPATRHNERLQEHLRRVAYAREHYTYDNQLDDRGKIYIRFGDPRYETNIRLDPYEDVTNNPDTEGVRGNEFWTYPHIEEKAYYLFVRDESGEYNIRGINDLFPTAELPDLSTLEATLRQLAAYHDDYAIRASEAFDRRTAAQNNEEFGIGEDPWALSPSSFKREMQRKNENEFRQNAYRRSERVPSSYSPVHESVGELPIQARMLRTLTSDGKTQIEIYWSLPTSSLQFTDELREQLDGRVDLSHFRSDDSEFIVRLGSVLERGNHVDETVRHRQYHVKPSSQKNSILDPRTSKLGVIDSTFHVALQWEQYTMSRDDSGQIDLGSTLRRHTQRYDTLSALDDNPQVLEMSDLKLLTVPDHKPPTAISSGEAIPYPFRQVSPTMPIALSFEVYHLGLDADDETQYTVSYEVHKQQKQGGLKGLFVNDEAEHTNTRTTHSGQDRTEEEFILLDTENFESNESQEVRVTVQVTDEVTGQQVERSIEFTLMPN